VLLGKSLGKAIIAEGIETAEQLEQLQGMGCTAGQGFHLSPPLTAGQIGRLLDGLVAQAPVTPVPQRLERPTPLH
jgi:EAL domain-containing protein (putative c-di-GMP-specific phosphodiesterase class I)